MISFNMKFYSPSHFVFIRFTSRVFSLLGVWEGGGVAGRRGHPRPLSPPQHSLDKDITHSISPSASPSLLTLWQKTTRLLATEMLSITAAVMLRWWILDFLDLLLNYRLHRIFSSLFIFFSWFLRRYSSCSSIRAGFFPFSSDLFIVLSHSLC